MSSEVKVLIMGTIYCVLGLVFARFPEFLRDRIFKYDFSKDYYYRQKKHGTFGLRILSPLWVGYPSKKTFTITIVVMGVVLIIIGISCVISAFK